MNKHFIVFFAILAIVTGPQTMAGDKGKHNKHRSEAMFIDYARVVAIEPIYRQERITIPKEQCWQEKEHKPIQYRTQHNEIGHIIMGGVIGGVVGHQIGQGKSLGIATVAGSAIGAAIGHELGSHSKTTINKVRDPKNCNSHKHHRKIRHLDGYWVTYRYKGEQFTTRMQERPGRRIQVMLKIMPYEG